MFRAGRYVFLSFVILLCNSTQAGAIINGNLATGSAFVVTMLPGIDSTPTGYCSGTYIAKRVVVTAAHCMVNTLGKDGDWRFPVNELYVSQAGINWDTTIAVDSRVRVLKIVVEPNYYFRFEPEKNNFESEINDIAFLFLERELDSQPVSRIATANELLQIKDGKIKLINMGYGCLFNNGVYITQNDGNPYRVDGITGTAVNPGHNSFYDKYLEVEYPRGTSLCPGDSGSPILFQADNETVFVGAIVSGRGWEYISRENFTVNAFAGVTVMWPFMDFYATQWSKFLIEEPEIRRSELVVLTDRIIADREIQLIADAQVIPSKIPPKPLVIKKITITCVKGKVIKKITALLPKCPSGFKKKP